MSIVGQKNKLHGKNLSKFRVAVSSARSEKQDFLHEMEIGQRK